MPYRRLIQHANAIIEVPRDLALGRYPEFVTGGLLARGHVPVFCFHSAEPETFTRKIRYLADNGYTSLSADEYFQFLMGTRKVPEKAVVLTFDDGRASVRSVAWPILRRFDMKAIVFLIPDRMSAQSGPLPPTLDDVHAGRAEMKDILARENGPDALLTWEEVIALSKTHIFDFASHTLTHTQIHTGPRPAGFITPVARQGFASLDIPVTAFGQKDLYAHQAPLGTPLLQHQPRLSEALRFTEDERYREAAIRLVSKEGGPGFFYRTAWQRELRAVIAKERVQGRYETVPERNQAIERELAASKAAIEERIGQTVRHLCYPWHVAGPTAERLTREVGYRTAFCGKVRGVPITLAGGNPLAIARIGDDYVELLPGRGRVNLSAILLQKWQRRFATIRQSGRP